MIRTPFLPLDEFFHHLNQSDSENYLLSFYAKDETLEKPLPLPPNLHEALQKYGRKKRQRTGANRLSLLKYVLRMADTLNTLRTLPDCFAREMGLKQPLSYLIIILSINFQT